MRNSSLKPVLAGIAIALSAAVLVSPARAQSQGERMYRGHYFNWQQSYDGRIFAWMSLETYRIYSTVGYGTRASGAFTVTAGNNVYTGTRYGQSSPNGLVLVELRRSARRPIIDPPIRTPPPGGCPPGDTHWRVLVTADNGGYTYEVKIVIRPTGEVVFALASGDRMHWVEGTGRVSGNQLMVNSVATVTDNRGQAVRVGGRIMATLKPGCLEGEGRTDSGQVPGVRNDSGRIKVVRVN